jgi:hypothetical protein
VVIFSRNRGSARRRGDADGGRGGRHVRTRDADDLDATGYGSDDDGPGVPEFGPFDLAQAPDDGLERLDLGALRIPSVPGVEVRLQASPDGRVEQIQLAHGSSRLQLGAYAAPRSEGIWDEIRASLRGSLHANGGRPQEVEGEYGLELRGRVKEGSTTTDVRHVGIDGPRWFVHGVYLGAAATDPERAGPLRDVLRGLIVDRGIEARPVSEPLPLRLPPEAAAQLNESRPMDSQAT